MVKKKFLEFFSTTVFTAILNVVLLFILSKKLIVEDFALFSIFSTFGAFSNGVLSSGLTFIFSRNKSQNDVELWDEVFSSSLLIIALIILIYILILVLGHYFEYFDIVNLRIIILICLSKICLDVPLSIYLEFYRIVGNSRRWSNVSLLNVLISFLVTILFAISDFDHRYVLFSGPFFSSAVLCGYLLISESMIHKFCFSITAVNFKILKTSLLSSSLENANNFFEKLFLSKQIGIYNFGLFNHALTYKQYFGLIGNSFANSIWANSLKESENDSDFSSTKKVWNIYYLLLFSASLISTFFSNFFLNIITNGLFIEAGNIIPILLISLFIVNSGKEDTAYLYRHNYGVFLNNNNSIRILFSVFCIILSVPFIGIYGAVIAIFFSNAVFRLRMHLKVKNVSGLKIRYNYSWVPLFFLSLIIYLFWVFQVDYYKFVCVVSAIFGLSFGIYINRNIIYLVINRTIK